MASLVGALTSMFRARALRAGSAYPFAAALVFQIGLVAPAHGDAFSAHYASLRGDKAYLREGPTFAHRVLWVYRRKGYPMRVIAAFDIWRRVADVDGTVGWMSASMLTDRRTILVTSKNRVPVRSKAAPSSRILAWAEPGVVAMLKACEVDECEISVDRIDGWIDKKFIWGVDAREVFE